jgi:cytochrome P450
MSEPDLLDPDLRDRDDILDELRARAPIAWRAGRRGPGYWAVTGYPELVAIARDPETFTSHLGTRPEVRRTADAIRPLHNLDPPAHTSARALADRFLAPDRWPALDPIISAHLDRFLPAAGDAMPMLVALVGEVFATWLGVADAAALAREVEHVHVAGAAFLDDPEPNRAAAAAATAALAARMREARAFAELGLHATLFVEAGIPTTIDALANALAAIVTRPARLAAALDASLHRAPIQQFARYATRDVVVAGVAIRAHTQVILWFGAANRDPRRGGDPHVAFGVGPHRCVGAAFARRILAAFFAQWFARVPAHRAIGERRASSYMNGFARLEIAI